MRTMSIAAVLGILVAVLLSLALISMQDGSDLGEDSILSTYGER